MTILKRFFVDLKDGIKNNSANRYVDPHICVDELLAFHCPSDFYDIPDINGCDRYDSDRCERCWNREYKEDQYL